jgi:hypothetical protein
MTDRFVVRLLRVDAAVGLLFGTVLLATPGWLLDLFGFRADQDALVVARLYGAEVIGFSVATVLASAGRHRGARTAVAVGHLFSEGIGAVVAAIALASGLGNALGWIIVVLLAGFAALFAYVLYAPRGVLRAGRR